MWLCRGASSVRHEGAHAQRKPTASRRRSGWLHPARVMHSATRRASSGTLTTAEGEMALKEYKPGTPFPGFIGRTTDVSTPAWPQPMRAAPGTPNVLVLVLDDTGYGQLGCYGSPIATPYLDALATHGLLFTNMHTTGLGAPSRSCIITGRNHHANAAASTSELATGYPGYNGNMPFENGFLSEILVQHGFSTFMVGKYDLLPAENESAAGPFDRWPLGRGFERFYGFLGSDT